jgi:hypothetical protein
MPSPCSCLLRGELKADAVDAFVARDREAFSTAQAMPREQDSVLGQLNFIQEMSEQLDGEGEAVPRVRERIQNISTIKNSVCG